MVCAGDDCSQTVTGDDTEEHHTLRLTLSSTRLKSSLAGRTARWLTSPCRRAASETVSLAIGPLMGIRDCPGPDS